MNEQLRTELLKNAPIFAADYERRVRLAYDRLVEKYPDKRFHRASSDHGSYQDYRLVSSMLVQENAEERGRAFCSMVIDERRLASAAEKVGIDTVTGWIGKISAKMGDLQDPDVKHVSGLTYVITGTRAGLKVRIDQAVTLSVSKHGLWFNQFPARIYVDGKFTPEKTFKAMVKEKENA